MTPHQISLVKNSWKVLQKMEPVLVGDAFYSRLFLEAPAVRPLFRSSRTEQANKLIATLAVVVNQLEKLDTLSYSIQQLAMRHIQYGVKAEHYQLVGNVLLWTLEHLLKENWNEDVAAAWARCYGILAETMINAASIKSESATL